MVYNKSNILPLPILGGGFILPPHLYTQKYVFVFLKINFIWGLTTYYIKNAPQLWNFFPYPLSIKTGFIIDTVYKLKIC